MSRVHAEAYEGRPKYSTKVAGLSPLEKEQVFGRLKSYKDEFNPHITDANLVDILNKGFEIMDSATPTITSPGDVVAVCWATEYMSAAQGQLSGKSFVKLVDNGKLYDALINYGEGHSEEKHRVEGEGMYGYPGYRRISTHCSEYSGEDRVGTLNPFSKATVPNQHGIDIRGDDGPMLPGGKGTVLFHREDPALNGGHKVLGMKFEPAGFPPVSMKNIVHTVSEAFNHTDRYIASRDKGVMKVVTSVMDVIKSAINVPVCLLSGGNVRAFDFVSSRETPKDVKPGLIERMFGPLLDLLQSVVNTVITIVTLGKFKPLGETIVDEKSFREHAKDVKVGKEKFGKEVLSFAKEVAAELGEEHAELADKVKGAAKTKRTGTTMEVLLSEEVQAALGEEKAAKLQEMQGKYTEWKADKGHSDATMALRSGNERIVDLSGELGGIGYSRAEYGHTAPADMYIPEAVKDS